MKIKALLTVVLAASLWCTALPVQASSPKIAVVDLQKVLENSIAGKASKSNLDKSVKETKAKLEIERLKLEQMQNELNKQKALLSGEAFENKRNAFILAERNFQRQVTDAQAEIEKKTTGMIDKIMEQVKQISAEIAGQRGYDFVIERDIRLVVFAADNIDVTKEVIGALDKKKLSL